MACAGIQEYKLLAGNPGGHEVDVFSTRIIALAVDIKASPPWVEYRVSGGLGKNQGVTANYESGI
jgi:hypothetical protein